MTHMYFWARTDGIRTFRHALRAAYRMAISAAQILVFFHFAIIVRVGILRLVFSLWVFFSYLLFLPVCL